MKTIYLDMDGVLCDFFTAAFDRVNFHMHHAYGAELRDIKDYPIGQYSIAKFFDISTKDFWKIIEVTGEGFWTNLKPYPWAVELYEHLKTEGHVIICTKPHDHPGCLSGKLKWLNMYLGIGVKDVIFCTDKSKLSRQESYLVDDNHSQLYKFNEHGGHFVMVPSNWSVENLTKEDVFTALYPYGLA